MSIFPQEQEIVSFKYPLFYSGDTILNSVQQCLKELRNKNELTAEEQKQKTFLHRVNSIIIRHKIYNLSIDEAVSVGLLE